MSSIPWRTGQGYQHRYPGGPRHGRKIRKPIVLKPESPYFRLQPANNFKNLVFCAMGHVFKLILIWLAKQSPKRILTLTFLIDGKFSIYPDIEI
jgi:hypothetical protein